MELAVILTATISLLAGVIVGGFVAASRYDDPYDDEVAYFGEVLNAASDTVRIRYPDIPIPSTWRHYNGNLYTVIGIANGSSFRPEYKATVVYRGENGNVWARPAEDWHRSMTPAAETDD